MEIPDGTREVWPTRDYPVMLPPGTRLFFHGWAGLTSDRPAAIIEFSKGGQVSLFDYEWIQFQQPGFSQSSSPRAS